MVIPAVKTERNRLFSALFPKEAPEDKVVRSCLLQWFRGEGIAEGTVYSFTEHAKAWEREGFGRFPAVKDMRDITRSDDAYRCFTLLLSRLELLHYLALPAALIPEDADGSGFGSVLMSRLIEKDLVIKNEASTKQRIRHSRKAEGAPSVSLL